MKKHIWYNNNVGQNLKKKGAIWKKNRENAAGEAIYDATKLGAPKMLLLGLQHMFAMFGATVLIPALTGLSVSDTLLFAGLGTFIISFHYKT